LRAAWRACCHSSVSKAKTGAVSPGADLPWFPKGEFDIADTVTIDGAHGEGGGQILRTALALSAITSRPLRIVNIRAKRHKPGLLPQHLSAARAAAAITGATLQGDQLGFRELIFTPSHPPEPGSYLFDVTEIAGRGSAGSAILVLQTILVPLALMQGRSELLMRGGHPPGMGARL
jgi:RNA 3'-terminal phosphate cyclase (ATP)